MLSTEWFYILAFKVILILKELCGGFSGHRVQTTNYSSFNIKKTLAYNVANSKLIKTIFKVHVNIY